MRSCSETVVRSIRRAPRYCSVQGGPARVGRAADLLFRHRPTEDTIVDDYPSRAINLKELVMDRDEDPQRPQSQPAQVCVNLDDEAKRAYWLASLGVSEEELRRVIAEVGPAARDVRLYLGRP